ncbi:hypothetical protein ACOME3_009417 [Neoechinorhynchus agilis]
MPIDWSDEHSSCPDFEWSTESERILEKLFAECSAQMRRKTVKSGDLEVEIRQEMKQLSLMSVNSFFSLCLYLRYCVSLRENYRNGKRSRISFIMSNNMDFDNMLRYIEHNIDEIKRRSVVIAKAKMNESYRLLSVLFPKKILEQYSDAPVPPEKFRKFSRRAFDDNMKKFKKNIYIFLNRHVSQDKLRFTGIFVNNYWKKLLAQAEERKMKEIVGKTQEDDLSWKVDSDDDDDDDCQVISV